MASRNTVQKDLIYSALCRLKNHPTADMVYTEVYSAYPSISRTTVYRVLNQMAQSGKVKKISINNGADCFDHQTHAHYHIRCERCGCVHDLQTPDFDKILEHVSDTEDFFITGFDVQFNGICSKCAGQ